MASDDARRPYPRRQAKARRPRRARAACRVEALEGRTLLATQFLNHLSGDLVGLYNAQQTTGQTAAASAGLAFARQTQMTFDDEGRVGVTVTAADVNAVLPALESTYGFQLTASLPASHLVSGYLPVGQLENVTALVPQGLLGVLPSYKPGTDQVGTFNDQAVNVLEADRVTATPVSPSNVTGAGVTVGVLSNSFNAKGTASTDEGNGNLPATVNVIQDDTASANDDEGRAMLQLIHHTAPGAAEAFATADFGGDAGFASNIHALANAGARVIADDVYQFDEPMFQDGVIAQAIDSVVTTQGVSYFSSAGNFDTQAYLNTSPSFVPGTVPGIGSGTFLNFTPGSGTNFEQGFTLTSTSTFKDGVATTLEWDSPFYTASGVQTSLNFYLMNTATNTVIFTSNTDATATQAPLQFLSAQLNSTGAANVAWVIQLAKGPAPGAVKWVNYGANQYGDTTFQYATGGPTIVGHAGSANAMAVGAAPYFHQTTPEAFTSLGPTLIYFDASGNRLGSPQTRAKPDVLSIDGTDNTLLGGDTEGDGFPNFFGTSAAAPHAAAVAALMLQHTPSLTPAQLYAQMKATATPVSASANLAGAGLVDAYRAVFGNPVPTSTPFSDGFETGAATQPWSVYRSDSGDVLATNAGTPSSGSYHLALQSSLDGYGLATLDEAILNVNATNLNNVTVSYDLKAFDGAGRAGEPAMPASFTGHGNYDGVSFSVDGNTWYTLQSVDITAPANQTYTTHTFNLSQMAQTLGLTLSADTRIKFQHASSEAWALTNDGIAIDNVAVTGTAAQSPTTTTLQVSPGPLVFGEPVTLTATVSPSTATGTVTFKDGATVLGTGTISGGVATFTTSALGVGGHSLTAAYGGDAGDAASTSTALNLAVGKAPTSTAVIASAGGSTFGQSLTFTATVSVNPPGSGTPTGTVTFTDGATTLGTVTVGAGGTAVLTTSALGAGAHAVNATYNGDANFRPSATGTISSVAGLNGTSGYTGDGGPANTAQLNFPHGEAFDSAGDLFIADTNNNVIREVLRATGNIITYAGTGAAGHTGDGGPATAATFFHPYSVALDSSDNLYITDGAAVREIVKATGVINTIAGNANVAGFSGDGGPATTALLNSPRGMAVDAAGDVFIADINNNEVREVVKATGNIIAFAGTGTAGYTGDGGAANLAELSHPSEVVLDPAGDLFIADNNNSVIREVLKATGDIVTVAGNHTYGYSGDGGPATSAEIENPFGLTRDAVGDLFIADNDADVIREVIAGSGTIITLAGTGTSGYSGDGGPAISADLDNVRGMTSDAAGDVFVADTSNSEIRRITPAAWVVVGNPPPAVATGAATSVTTTGATLSATVNPNGSTTTARFQYSTDPTFTPTVQTQVGSGFLNPQAVAIDALGDVFVADSNANAVKEVLPDGTIRTIGSGFVNPVSVAVDAVGDVFVGQLNSGSLVKVRPDGSMTSVGSGFNVPAGLAVDAAGDVFVADLHNSAVKEVLPNGTIRTVQSGLNGPISVAVDAAGDVFVANYFAGVEEILPGGGTRAVGSGFSSPDGVAVDPFGDVFVTVDQPSNSVYEVLPDGTVKAIDPTSADSTGVAADAAGDIVVAMLDAPDYTAGHVIRLTPTSAPASPSPLTGSTAQPVSATLAGLIPGTTYYYRVVASNAGGTVADRSLHSFTTLAQSDTTVAASANPSVYGQSVTFTATVSVATATGTVTFMDGSTVLGTGTLDGTTGTATFTTAALTVGAHSITAVYGGDASDAGGTSDAVTETVHADATTTAVSSSANPVEAGQPVTFTATVTQAAPGTITPTGLVQFKVDGKALGSPVAVSGGVAVSPGVSNLAAGSHTVTAAFVDASGSFGSSTGTLAGQKVVADTSTGLSASASATAYGQPVTFTAVVTNLDKGNPVTGSVTFFDGTRALGSAVVSGGQAVFTTSTLAVGAAHSVTATYNGSSVLAKSTSAAVGVTVSQAGTTTTESLNPTGPVTYGTPVTFTLSVSNNDSPAVPTGGAVTIYLDYGTASQRSIGGAALVNGSATFTTKPNTIPGGSHTVTAVYAGTANFAGSSSASAGLTVNPAGTTTTDSFSPTSPVAYGTPVTFTLSVSNNDTSLPPTGAVTVYLDYGTTAQRSIGAALLVNGSATLTTKPTVIPAGTHTVIAVYAGSASFAASSSASAGLTVNPAATAATLVSSTGSTEYGTPVMFTATVSNSDSGVVPAGGAVTFYLDYGTAGQKSLGAAGLVNGTASFTTKPSALPGGSHTVTAVYAGTASFQAATSNAVSQSVSPANTSVVLSSTASGSVAFGTAVTFTATVTDPDTGQVPAGQVQFFDGTTLVGTAAVNLQGKAVWTKSLGHGPHSITAVYVATANFNGSTSNAVALNVS
jgi:hypothetical protein